MMTKAEWKKPQLPPVGPYSKNVREIKYGSRLHRRLKKELNANSSKGGARFKFHRQSLAVLWDGQPWYWNRMGNYLCGSRGRRRPLHRCIWEKANGRPVPAGYFIIFKDGNKNNLAPANLVLCSGAKLISRAHQFVPVVHLKSLVMHRWNRLETQKTSTLLKRFNRRKSP